MMAVMAPAMPLCFFTVIRNTADHQHGAEIGISQDQVSGNHKITEPLLLKGTAPSKQKFPRRLSTSGKCIQTLPHQNDCCSSSKNLLRLTEARLHAVLSRNIYSEHGLDALMRPPFGQVCHSLMVVSYCVPGSAQRHAA